MSKKNSLLNFVNIVNILVEPWTNNRIKEYEALFSQLKTNREKVAVMLLTIFFQIPKISIKSTKILSEKCHISINEVPNSLPQIVYNCLFRLIPVLSVKKDMTYTKVALVCASSLPPSQLHFLFEVFIKYPEFHLAQSVYSVLFERDPTLSNYFAENFDKCESILPYVFSSLNLQPFPNEFILKIASLFLSGKFQTTSPFFYSFCFYINRHIFPIDFETTDYFVLTLFQKIETFFAPHSHSYLFHLISQQLNDYPLPFISIHLFFQDFDENQIKSIFTTLIKENGSIKSFFVLSQIVSSEKMKELYSIATCTRFCTYTAMKKNIYFFKRSLEKITSLHFELRVLSKVLEIASLPEFQDISFEFLDIFKPFTATAAAMSDILKIFFTRDKKLISGLISKNADSKANILTALYLLGNSPIGANPNLKTRYKSLTKSLIPRLSINGLQINCLMPKSLSTTLTKKNLSNDELVTFYYNLTVKQIKPAPFKVENAINIISLFQMNHDELGYKIRENPEVPPNSFDNIKSTQYAEKNEDSKLNHENEMNILNDDENDLKINEQKTIAKLNKEEENENKKESNIKLSKTGTNSKTKPNNSNQKLSNSNQKINNSNQKINNSNQKLNNSNQKLNNSKTKLNNSNQKLNKNIKAEVQSKDTKTKSKKDIKKVISNSVDLNIDKPENRSFLSETVAVVEPTEKVHDYQIQSAVVENIEEKKQPKLVLEPSLVENIEEKDHNMALGSSVIDDIKEKPTKMVLESSVIADDVDEKPQKMVLQSSIVDDIEEKSHSFVLESSTIDDVKEKAHKMVIQSSTISSLEPIQKVEKLNEIKLKFESSVIFNLGPIYKNDDKKPLKLIIQSSVITSKEPEQTSSSKKKKKLVLQSSVVSDFEPIIKEDDQKAFNFSNQNFVVLSIKPVSKKKIPLQLEKSQSVSRINQSKTGKTVSSIIASIEPTKTAAQIELEKLQKISKYNISTQVSLANNNNNQKKVLKISDNSVITEKVSSAKINSIGICYNSNNNFETNLLSDDNLSSSELLDQEELPMKSSNTKQLKNSDTKNQKQLKNSDTKNQKQLKISENKNQKQLKNQSKNTQKNQNQKKNVNQNNPTKDQGKDLIKSHSFSLSKARPTKSLDEPPSKQKSQPNLPRPPSDSKKNMSINIDAAKNIKSQAEKSDAIPNIPRPKSMNNMSIENEDDVDISSDDIGFALPSDDYEFSNSKSSYSGLSGLSDLDENELNQMFGDDEQVQMFADMLLPPDK